MGAEKPCDATSATVFIVGLVAGTGCIIVAKMLFELKAVGSTGELEVFNPPVFETFVMVRSTLARQYHGHSIRAICS